MKTKLFVCHELLYISRTLNRIITNQLNWFLHVNASAHSQFII